MRQVVLDTETTGLEAAQGHRIIEIGCVEVCNRRLTNRHYHQYLNPERKIDAVAMDIHGLTDEFVADKPLFSTIAADFLEFIDGAELIIHNAPFDVGFLNAELARLPGPKVTIEARATITDSLVMARRKHPGQRNSLDALCQRYHVDNAQRELHGALLDAEILADVFLAMTGGQTALALNNEDRPGGGEGGTGIRRLSADRPPLPVIHATADELQAHHGLLDSLGGGRW